MTISLSGVHVLVDDPDAALSFYRDTLGLTPPAADA
jgi:catechol 2,3-dioxygenase-like lactoylglutathione lyase family enzyme